MRTPRAIQRRRARPPCTQNTPSEYRPRQRYDGRTLVFVFGTICIDRLRRVSRLPSPGGYVEIESETAMLGGEAANTAYALTNWGDEVSLAGNHIGSGPDADALWHLIESKGLPTEWLGKSQQPLIEMDPAERVLTPVCEIYVTPDGERTMFGQGFARSSPGVPLESLPFRFGHWFTAEPNMSSFARIAVRLAHGAGMRTYTMDFIRDDEPIAPGSFWQSSTDWVGHRGNIQRNIQWVKEHVRHYGCHTILSDGPNGFVAGGPGLPVRAYPPFPAPAVVDTTGAGDMFRAGMLHGLEREWPLYRCLQFAASAGCLKCRSFGATSAVPTVEEIENHIFDNPDVARQYL